MDLSQQVKDAIVNLLRVKPNEIKPGMTLEDSLGVDSTEMVEMCVALGKKFNVRIEANEISKKSTPEDIERVVKAKLG